MCATLCPNRPKSVSKKGPFAMTFVSSLCEFIANKPVTGSRIDFVEGFRRARWMVLAAVLLGTLVAPERGVAQINVNTTTQGNTSGNACSLQEAIYAAEFGQAVALDQTDPDDTYSTGCSDPSGKWDTIVLQNT